MKRPKALPSEKWTPLTIPRFVARPARLFSAAKVRPCSIAEPDNFLPERSDRTLIALPIFS